MMKQKTTTKTVFACLLDVKTMQKTYNVQPQNSCGITTNYNKTATGTIKIATLHTISL